MKLCMLFLFVRQIRIGFVTNFDLIELENVTIAL